MLSSKYVGTFHCSVIWDGRIVCLVARLGAIWKTSRWHFTSIRKSGCSLKPFANFCCIALEASRFSVLAMNLDRTYKGVGRWPGIGNVGGHIAKTRWGKQWDKTDHIWFHMKHTQYSWCDECHIFNDLIFKCPEISMVHIYKGRKSIFSNYLILKRPGLSTEGNLWVRNWYLLKS